MAIRGGFASATRCSTVTPRTTAAAVYRQAVSAACRSYAAAPLAISWTACL
ncbi:hypothetical protein [Streptomyces gelaticus]|uniref:hypothetical protein n=1 Tax=Streptomyces gelaticus TaxID=285446 RepID=UPI001E59A1BB|nr:hypothetical protein [Streptomyces gelaticus]